MEILERRFANLPVWAWLIAGAGGILLAVWISKRGGSKGSNSAYNPSGIPADPNIDPVTGVPWQVEEAINPATGLPAYYGTQSPGGASSPPSTTVPNPPGSNPPGSGFIPPPTPAPTPAPPPGKTGAQKTGHGTGSGATGGKVPSGDYTPPTNPPGGGGGGKLRAGPAAAMAPMRTYTQRPWPAGSTSLHDVWREQGRGIPYQQWQQHVQTLNPGRRNPDTVFPWEELVIP